MVVGIDEACAADFIRAIHDRDLKCLRRKHLFPDETLQAAHDFAVTIQRAADSGEPPPYRKGSRSALIGLLPTMRRDVKREKEWRKGDKGWDEPEAKFQVYGPHIRAAESVIGLLNRHGWHNDLPDIDKIELATPIMIELLAKFPGKLENVRTLPRYLQGFADTGGIQRWYYRHAGHLRPLPGQPGQSIFMKAYVKAYEAEQPTPPKAMHNGRPVPQFSA